MTGRNFGIDAGRYVLAFLVILLHSIPQSLSESAPDWAVATGIACRCAVPVFFMIAGYFVRPDQGTVATAVWRPIIRLTPIYAFWMTVYFAACGLTGVRDWTFAPRDLVSGGTAFHLWFIPVLILSTIAVSILIRLAGYRAAAALCILLAAVGLLRGAYYGPIFGEGVGSRNALLIAPAFVCLGAVIARSGWAPSLKTAALLALAGYLMLCAEMLLIAELGPQRRWVAFDFGAATFVYALGIFALLLSARGEAVERVATLGSLGLSVYAVHVLILWWLQPAYGPDPVSRLALAMSVLALSTLAALGLQRIPYLGRFVR